MSARVKRRPALRVHWTAATCNPVYANPECGANSYQVTTRLDIVTCPRCMERRAFKCEALRGLDVTIGGAL